MTFVSIVGHAIFHTAGCSGPSMMERSYRRLPAGVGVAAAGAGATGTVLSLAGTALDADTKLYAGSRGREYYL